MDPISFLSVSVHKLYISLVVDTPSEFRNVSGLKQCPQMMYMAAVSQKSMSPPPLSVGVVFTAIYLTGDSHPVGIQVHRQLKSTQTYGSGGVVGGSSRVVGDNIRFCKHWQV